MTTKNLKIASNGETAFIPPEKYITFISEFLVWLEERVIWKPLTKILYPVNTEISWKSMPSYDSWEWRELGIFFLIFF